MQRMVFVAIEQTWAGYPRRVPVSLPLIACLVDGVKYRTDDVTPPEDKTERYRLSAPRLNLRRLVLLSVARDAESEARKFESRHAAAAARPGRFAGPIEK